MTLSDRLNQLIKEKAIKKSDLADATRSPRATVSDWTSGKIKALSADKLLLVCKFFNVNPEWVANGRGPMYKAHSNVTSSDKKLRKVMVLSYEQAAVFGDKDVNYPTDIRTMNTSAEVSDSAFCILINDDSMTSPSGQSIPEGASVIIDANEFCGGGHIVLAVIGGTKTSTLKKLVINGGQRFLKPLNPAYPTLTMTEACRIIGRAVSVEYKL